MRISVVIPCYNCTATIGRTLESIFRQSRPPEEIVTVDDGSTDNTLKVLNGFSSRIAVESQANRGVSATRNRGVEMAGGEWIAFCDSDDLWHPAKLEIMARAAEEAPGAEFIFHDFTMVRDGEVLAERSSESALSLFPIFKRSGITMAEILTDHRQLDLSGTVGDWPSAPVYTGNALYWLMMGNFIQPSTLLIKRKLFVESGGFDEEFRVAEDTELFLRLSKRADYSYVDLPLMTYEVRGGSLLHANLLLTVISGTRALVRHCVEDREVYERYPGRIDRAVARKYSRLGYFYLSELMNSEARSSAREALRYRSGDGLAWAVLAGSLVPRPLLKAVRRIKSGLS
jgi:glycosyltransferase involved in cell wall biosynthesis